MSHAESALPWLPPARRSHICLRLTAAAAVGRFELQRCARCSAVQYPPREACHRCLSVELEWTPQSGAGRLISSTTLRHSHDPFFRARLPWPIGLVKLDCGPTVVTHLHQSVGDAPCEVRVTVRLDRAGQAALVARAPSEDVRMNDDPRIREMSCDPRGCNVLVTDPFTALGRALVAAFCDAGANSVSGGTPAGRIDILVNNSAVAGPQADPHEQMEVNYFGLLRLWQQFGPESDAPVARAWVNVLALDALCNLPSQSTFSASMAAALSLSQGMRARARPHGLQVVNVFPGPMSAESLARSVVQGLVEGVEDLYPGELAQQWLASWIQSPKILEREVASHE